MKEKSQASELILLELLKRVLPKADIGPETQGAVYAAVEAELKAKARQKSFDAFLNRCPLPDMHEQSIQVVRDMLGAAYGDGDIAIKEHNEEKLLHVEVSLPDGRKFTGQVKVHSDAPESEEQEIKLKQTPLAICLPTDTGLAWLFSKPENVTEKEAVMLIEKISEDFWVSKTGQRLLRDRVEKTFAEFVQRCPAGAFKERGIKRLFKEPTAISLVNSI